MREKLLIALLLAGSMSARAQVKLQPLFTDNMVLQQQADVPIWGEDKAGKKVTVTTSWDKRKYTTTTAANGKWKVSVATPKAGGPYSITISDGKTVRLNNVLIGEVWLCSGQSNMEMPIVGWGNDYFKAEHKDADNHPNIRLLQLNLVASMTPDNHFTARNNGWTVCNYTNLAPFSATAYFFGRDLEKHLNVPIGLIQTCWGGTVAEAWTGKESLELDPDFTKGLKNLSEMSASKENAMKKYEGDKLQWQKNVDSKDAGMKNGKAVWAAPGFNDESWMTMKVPGLFSQNGLEKFDGLVWFRHTVDIPSSMTGKALTLRLGSVDDIDVTYFNGVRIGQTEGWAKERVYQIPARLVKAGRNVIAVRNLDTGGDGGLYGKTEQFRLTAEGQKGAGQGTQEINLSGEWRYKVSTGMQELPAMPANPNGNPNLPTVLYNAMINPLIPYTIKGAIWYQGEANASRAYQYRDLLPLMINDWRSRWGYRFPFYIVQLANFMARHDHPTESAWAELREAQALTTNLDNTGVSCTIDIGMEKDIHPSNKQDVGHRLALIARAETYGQNVEFSGPLYKSYEMMGHCIRIHFDHTTDGLKTNDDRPVTGFAIAGPDHVWHWATATVDGNSVIVSSDKVKFPVAVRYAWADNPACNLYNGANLPAFPFRTDCWNGVTYGVK